VKASAVQAAMTVSLVMFMSVILSLVFIE